MSSPEHVTHYGNTCTVCRVLLKELGWLTNRVHKRTIYNQSKSILFKMNKLRNDQKSNELEDVLKDRLHATHDDDLLGSY